MRRWLNWSSMYLCSHEIPGPHEHLLRDWSSCWTHSEGVDRSPGAHRRSRCPSPHSSKLLCSIWNKWLKIKITDKQNQTFYFVSQNNDHAFFFLHGYAMRKMLQMLFNFKSLKWLHYRRVSQPRIASQFQIRNTIHWNDDYISEFNRWCSNNRLNGNFLHPLSSLYVISQLYSWL